MSVPLAAWLERQWWTPTPTLGAHLLAPLAMVYESLALRAQRRAKPTWLPVPVIVVGNVVVGGAGKTPTTIALVQALQHRGFQPGVVSRGYGRTESEIQRVSPSSTAQDVGDEPRLIERLTTVPVVVGGDRVAAAQALLSMVPTVNVIVADDGLQHHRLGRDAQVIVIDERGFGNGRLLPAGPLRQRISVVKPEPSVVLYNATQATTPWPGWLAQRHLKGLVRLASWHARGAVEPWPVVLRALRDRSLVAAAGIASPTRFFTMLHDCGLAFRRVALPDHFDWQHWPTAIGDSDVIVTEKDAVKLPTDHPLAARIWVAPLDFTLPDELLDALFALIAAKLAATAKPP